MDDRTFVFDLRCATELERIVARSIAAAHADPGDVHVQRLWSFPGGVERIEEIPHRVGHYFERVELGPDLPGPPWTFGLTYVVRPGVGAAWKNLIVRTMLEIRRAVGAGFDSRRRPDRDAEDPRPCPPPTS